MSKSSLNLRWFAVLILIIGGAASLWRWAEPPRPPLASRTAVALLDGSEDRKRTVPSRLSQDSSLSNRRLFSFARPLDASGLSAALPAPAYEIRYVRVDASLVNGKQSPFWQGPGAGRFELPLPDGGSVTVVIDSSEMLGADRFTSVGSLEGRPGSRARFAWNAGFLHASIEDPVLGKFALRVVTEEFSQLYRVAPELVLPCGGERLPPKAAAEPARVLGAAGSTPTTPEMAAAENPQRAEVHLMMVYSQLVLPTLAGTARAAALQSAFDLAIVEVNDVMVASQITARVKLVKVVETQYDENRSGPTKVQDDALTALYLEEDGQMDEIHALRDRVGADVVMLALQRRDSASSGLSFLLTQANDAGNPRFAFSVVQYSSIAGTTVVSHELGHVFGCAHDRENALSGPGAYSYSYGYRFFGADGAQYRDIMAYPPGIELSYYSNPRILAPRPASVPLGIAAGRPGEADAAQTVELNAFATSAYRLQTQAAISPGSLINVATRAYVGRGEEVLIGGFVVRGTQPKPILIRAAGPALAAFGVTDALADPILNVFSAGALVAENDNWSIPAGRSPSAPAEIAAAALQSSAFPFVAGSNDAAALVTLPPGAYTAVVEGAQGTTGSGLVEAYELEAGAAKIVNLATRGFAGRDGKEMVGGFVVKGAPGATKRILIRVLGPTLGRAPFFMTNVMDDPEMELRNSAGDLLLKADDWSSGADGGASQVNDFKPLVELYSEKQIFATGLAPPNRREPCVLVDLPPGSYTIIVRPYELRSTKPTLDQPAKPGVGVVEVYEIEP